ncbi:MAG TPA: DUF998 domain-containing protein [Anaerolineaceae bacterium]|nr:DUF998 domain-containing protein [Anaerolineaceae bacterium]
MMLTWLMSSYPALGLAGSLVILTGALVPALFYRGKEGEHYSVTRHFISELGELGVSRLAVVFNGSLIVAGLLFLLMLLGVGMDMNSVWGYIAMTAGIITAISCVFVGIFPMNYIKPHTVAAMTYFRAGLVTVLLFSIAIIVQPAAGRVIPLYALFFGVFSLAAYAAFLIHAGNVARKQAQSVLDTEKVMKRPRFWWMPFLEWLVLISTILWFLVICTAR